MLSSVGLLSPNMVGGGGRGTKADPCISIIFGPRVTQNPAPLEAYLTRAPS